MAMIGSVYWRYPGGMPVLVTFADRTPVVADSAWVAQNATLVGGVTLGERVGVFYGAVLRADNADITIGDDSNLQDNVVMHVDVETPATIGRRVTVGHGAILHGCTVEDDCLIGMGATVMNRAVIGTGSFVAAGALVLEDTVVPPGSLVAGVPAKIRREVSDGEREMIRSGAEGYVARSAAHKAAGG
jgi:carbonic anhydrase/acetyltransferase-like protein (isoleucine patch superfamily)